MGKSRKKNVKSAISSAGSRSKNGAGMQSATLNRAMAQSRVNKAFMVARRISVVKPSVLTTKTRESVSQTNFKPVRPVTVVTGQVKREAKRPSRVIAANSKLARKVERATDTGTVARSVISDTVRKPEAREVKKDEGISKRSGRVKSVTVAERPKREPHKCKERPTDNRGSGGSRGFIPWCGARS